MYPFREGSFAVRNGWYVAGFVNELGRKLLARTILGQPVVMYRKEDGTAVAVGGRCPHRHFPLGESCLKGDAIQCGYHGITFGPDGQCVKIPSQAHAPRSYRIPTYPLVEHGIWAWIWMGDPDKADPDKADPALLPDLEEIGAAGQDLVLRPFYVEHVKGRYQLLNDNLLDLTHLGYLHAGSIGTEDNASAPEELTKEHRVLRSRRYIRDAVPPPVVAQFNGDDIERVDRVIGMDFYLPGFHAGISDMQIAESNPVRQGEVLNRGRVYHAVTPETPTTCHYFFALSARTEEEVDRAFPYLQPVIAEDKFATEEIEKMLAIIGENPDELLIRSDRNAVEGRRMLQAMMDAEAEAPQGSPGR
ncbi:MAG: Rieske 2Fe-2S domain-containing protein [Altererythrobacter sp.]|nr:Rieske 2Fe-2S domain-containing protein [Altererythrobacter sp.]OJU58817.1 MAG: iron-sulfur protein [Altererythrobacter sp. 66-12]